RPAAEGDERRSAQERGRAAALLGKPRRERWKRRFYWLSAPLGFDRLSGRSGVAGRGRRKVRQAGGRRRRIGLGAVRAIGRSAGNASMLAILGFDRRCGRRDNAPRCGG